MIFLIEYDRKRGQLVTLESFDDQERQKAEAKRFELELCLHRQGVEHEVVTLQAPTEAAIRRTHRRYFEDLAQLAPLP
jgi:hypothetical protein